MLLALSGLAICVLPLVFAQLAATANLPIASPCCRRMLLVFVVALLLRGACQRNPLKIPFRTMTLGHWRLGFLLDASLVVRLHPVFKCSLWPPTQLAVHRRRARRRSDRCLCLPGPQRSCHILRMSCLLRGPWTFLLLRLANYGFLGVAVLGSRSLARQLL